MRNKELQAKLANQSELIRLLEDLEAGKINTVLAVANVGFSDDKNLHHEVVSYIESLGGSVHLVADGPKN